MTMLGLVDYRSRVADLYGDLRSRGVDESSWHRWREDRERLLLTHPQSSFVGTDGVVSDPPQFYDYDPTWQVIGRVEPWHGAGEPPSLTADDGADFTQVGTVRFERLDVVYSLGVFWLNGYAGGLFVPFRDETNGDTTYGGGRYILDTAKSADLGPPPGPIDTADDVLLLDFNFAYHPSCAWDPQWQCPLAPVGNRLAVAVAAGEQRREPVATER